MPERSPRYLSVKDFSEQLSISRITCYRWARQRLIASVKMGGRLLIPIAEFQRLDEKAKIPQTLEGEQE